MTVLALLLTIVAGLITLLLYSLWRRLHYWQRLRIPHDAPHPVYGNVSGYGRTRSFGDIVQQLYLKHRDSGPFCGYYFFQRPAVLVLDLTLAKQVLIQDFANFSNRGLYYNERDDPLSAHLFRLDGDKWRALRHKLTPTFTTGKMKFMFPTVCAVAERLIATLDAYIAAGEATALELQDVMARYTTDVIGQCAFGIACNSLRDPQAEFRAMGRRMLTARRHGALARGFIQSFPQLARWLRMRIVHQDVHDFIMRVVRENVAYREAKQLHASDFMQLLLELRQEHKLSVEQMAAQVLVFFAGGFETSSSTLSFVLYELALQPLLQQRVRDEIAEVLARNNGVFTYEATQQLQYMKQVIAETLRKYPILPTISRQALADYVVPGQSTPQYVIRKGMMVTIPVIGIHHDPVLYPAPEKFDPERFAPEQVQQRESVEWLAFGDGPRNCIGARFGQMQMRVGLTYLLKNFKFSTCDKTEIPLPLGRALIVTPANGVHLQVERI